MDRKGVFGLIIAVALFAGWNFYYLRHQQEVAAANQRAEAAAAALEAANPKPVAPPPVTPTGTPGNASAPTAPAVPRVEEKTELLSTKAVDYAFTNLGGGVRSATLLDHLAEKENKVVLNQFGSIPIGAVSPIAGENVLLPYASKIDANAGVITFERTDDRQIQLTKTFTLPKAESLSGKERLREEYLLRLELTFANRGQEAVEIPVHFVHTGASAPIHQNDQPIYIGYNFFRGSSNKFIDVNWFVASGIPLFGHAARPVYPEKPELLDDIRWAGVTNQYFTTLVTPLVDPKALSDEQMKQRGVALWARRYLISNEAWHAAGHASGETEERAGVDGAIGMGGFKLAPGESLTRHFNIYAGPGEYRRLRELGTYEAEIMDFGIFGLISKGLLNTMNTFKGWFGNYALAIIVLTIIIKLLMWPLQNKATASMKKMQALAPKMTELREKYKDDPQRMNTEVMQLYKTYGVNPFGGCLPMLVQIPIFFGFYNMLGRAVELRNSQFLWVDDLSLPDTVFHVVGIPINILPLLMAATMFWTMALQPKAGDPMQQRVFMFVPLIFIFFCYNFASALALYWTVQNVFSVVQLYVTRKSTAPALEKVALPKPKR